MPSCRPGDKVGGGGGETVSKQNFFQPFGPQFGLKIRRTPGPPGPSPGYATYILDSAILSLQQAVCISFDGNFITKNMLSRGHLISNF